MNLPLHFYNIRGEEMTLCGKSDMARTPTGWYAEHTTKQADAVTCEACRHALVWCESLGLRPYRANLLKLLECA